MQGDSELTDGQRDSLAELHLVEAQDGGLRVESWRHTDGWLVVTIALDCTAFQAEHQPGGLRLRGREFMKIHVPPSYPLHPPGLSVSHHRFSGYENALRGGGICVFRSPDTEWNPSDGMAVFVNDRVWGWLHKAVRNKVEQQGGMFHAPLLRDLQALPGVMRYTADEPSVDGIWSGFARIRLSGRTCYDQTGPILEKFTLVDWNDKFSVHYKNHVEGAAILLPKRVGFYFPKTLGDLFRCVNEMGLPPEHVVEHLGRAARRSERGKPLFLVIGVPLTHKDEQADGRKHRLTTLLIADEAADLIWQAGGTKSKVAAVAAVLDKADELSAYVLFDSDSRPGVATRRDRTAPADWFRDKTVAIWGAGALGGPIAIMVARAGATRIILRDRGYVHSGLLVRQPYTAHDEEVLKVDALRYRLRKIRPGLDVVVSNGDLRTDLSELEEWQGNVDLVINATASIPVRAALDLARNTKVAWSVPVLTIGIDSRAERGFARLLLPDAVMSNEELERDVQIDIATKADLHTYADAFFPDETSESRDPFYPEPGCSDSTFVGSAIDMAALSGTMLNWAAQSLVNEPKLSGIALLTSQPHVSLKSGEPSAYVVRAQNRTSLVDRRRMYTVKLGPGVVNQIRCHITAGVERNGSAAETGGPLWGACDDVRRMIWVDSAGPAPPHSVETEDQFACSAIGLSEEATRISAATRGATGFIGTWHTHPSCPPVPSSRDRASMADVCTRTEPLPRRFLMMKLGSPHTAPDIEVYVFRRDEYLSTNT